MSMGWVWKTLNLWSSGRHSLGISWMELKSWLIVSFAQEKVSYCITNIFYMTFNFSIWEMGGRGWIIQRHVMTPGAEFLRGWKFEKPLRISFCVLLPSWYTLLSPLEIQRESEVLIMSKQFITCVRGLEQFRD